ncbi:hypothetical protein [Pseudoalteromonas marina]|jgi:hypothetical protein|uniref:hypothetical protein n=1 Tax=Pseudoalteromonas marina TaxID=267375 RepID=UPI002735F264|nr:hypothetical protein [Pseudoalteromonas marina]MDP2486904.1 hypothetical protein [Pseudoalteromonas marina]
MDIQELNHLPEGNTNIEKLLEQYPTSYFNLANTTKPLMACELSDIADFGDKIKGLNILLDTADDYDSENLWPFTDLEYLKLSFTENDVCIENFSNFQNWLMNITSLKVVYFPEVEESTEFTSFIIHSLSTNKPYPLIVIYKAKRKPHKHSNDNTDSVYVPGNRKIYQVSKRKEVELTQESVQEIIEEQKLKSPVPHKELTFSGFLEIDSGDWQLDIKSLVIDQYNEVIISVEGKDDDGMFKCSGRCNWNDAEGGFYFASRLPVEYFDYGPDADYASIKLNVVEINELGECIVKGAWVQNSEQWLLEGTLFKNKSKQSL